MYMNTVGVPTVPTAPRICENLHIFFNLTLYFRIHILILTPYIPGGVPTVTIAPQTCKSLHIALDVHTYVLILTP